MEPQPNPKGEGSPLAVAVISALAGVLRCKTPKLKNRQDADF